MFRLNILVEFSLLFMICILPNPPVVSSACLSTIPEAERVDCAAGIAVTEGICRSRNCVWCTTATKGIPHCFYGNGEISSFKDFLKMQCPSCSYCAHRKDCHQEPGATKEKCLARGCQWCTYPSGTPCGPMCLYGDSDKLYQERRSCLSCGACNVRVDCHPEPDADPGKCLSRGCRWCLDKGDSSKPACVHSVVKNLVTEARMGCQTCSDCKARVDCYPESGATSELCLKRNCIWCPTNEPGQPYCVYGGSGTPYQNWCPTCSYCNTKIPCPPGIENPTQLQCEFYGCLWCPLKSFNGPKCVHKLC